jgi:multisubunit Na+/H+ antiporter MnhB subunit
MKRALIIIVLVVLGYFIFDAVNLDYGRPRSGVSEYYIAKGVAETGALNLVTAIYLNYRVYDTLGEATVFFASALGVYMLLRKLKKGETDG